MQYLQEISPGFGFTRIIESCRCSGNPQVALRCGLRVGGHHGRRNVVSWVGLWHEDRLELGVAC